MPSYRAPHVRNPRPWAPPTWAAWSGAPSAPLFADHPTVPIPDLARRPIPPDRPVVTVPPRMPRPVTRIPVTASAPPLPPAARVPTVPTRGALGQWEALIPVVASVAGSLLDGGGGGAAGMPRMTQLATQRTTVTPVQSTNIVLQTGGGTISTPTSNIVPPVVLPEEGVAVGAPGAAGRPAAVVEEVRQAGLGGIPWWVWLVGGGLVLWALWE